MADSELARKDYEAGMKYKDIAAQLGITEKTVEHEMARAMKLLRGYRTKIFYSVSLML